MYTQRAFNYADPTELGSTVTSALLVLIASSLLTVSSGVASIVIHDGAPGIGASADGPLLDHSTVVRVTPGLTSGFPGTTVPMVSRCLHSAKFDRE
jgi:hypothetical protein